MNQSLVLLAVAGFAFLPGVGSDYPAPQLKIYSQAQQTPGKYYFTNSANTELDIVNGTPYGHYRTIMKNDGTVSYKSKTNEDFKNFIPYSDGKSAYGVETDSGTGGSETDGYFVLEDAVHKQLRTYKAKSPFTKTDMHEFIRMGNGHILLLTWYTAKRDIPRGSPFLKKGRRDAPIIFPGIQEQDANGKVVWSWKSDEHGVEYDEAFPDDTIINWTRELVDAIHANSLAIDPADQNILLSCRHLDCVMKIDRSTGDIIWRLGGKKSSFAFNSSAQRFSHQHCAYVIPDDQRLGVIKTANQHILLFDNGNLHRQWSGNTPGELDANPYSRAAEYELTFGPDGSPDKAVLVWSYKEKNSAGFNKHLTEEEKKIYLERYRFSASRGSVQRLTTLNTLICWGQNGEITSLGSSQPFKGPILYNSAFSEVTSKCKKVMEVKLPDSEAAYRALIDEQH